VSFALPGVLRFSDRRQASTAATPRFAYAARPRTLASAECWRRSSTKAVCGTHCGRTSGHEEIDVVISDHAEGLGVMYQVYDENPALISDPTLARWGKALKARGQEAGDAMTELISAQAQGKLPAPVKDPKIVGPVIRTVWRRYTATAEAFNEPGRFTAMVGFEWTSVPGGNNLHRNVLFRDGKDKADQILPFSSWQSEDPEKLWEWMAKYEPKTGGHVLAIPHNANLSNGRMFEPVDFAGHLRRAAISIASRSSRVGSIATARHTSESTTWPGRRGPSQAAPGRLVIRCRSSGQLES
jgi:hypothetical protein